MLTIFFIVLDKLCKVTPQLCDGSIIILTFLLLVVV